MSRKADACGAGTNYDALTLEDVSNLARDIIILTSDQVWRLLDDSDFSPKPPVHLGELEADVAAPDDDEMSWHVSEGNIDVFVR